MGRPLRYAAIMLAVPALALPGWVLYHSRDLESVDESGLEIDERPLPDERNAAFWLDRAAGRLSWLEDSERRDEVQALRSFSDWKPEAAGARIDADAAALADIDRALAQSEMRVSVAKLSYPEVEGELPSYLRWPNLGRLLALRSAVRSAESDHAAAFVDAIGVLRLGSQLQRARQATLVHAMLGVSLQEIGLDQLRLLVPRARVSPGQAREWIDAIEDARARSDDWARVWAGEYWQARPSYEWALVEARDQPWWRSSAYLVQHNRSLQLMADRYRGLQRNSAVACAQMQPLREPRSGSALDRAALALRPNILGEIVFQIAAPRMDGFQRRRCRLASAFSAAQLAIALKAWRDERGHLPQRLEQLAPAYFEDLPEDGVLGAPLRYAPSERALYAPTEAEPRRFDLGF